VSFFWNQAESPGRIELRKKVPVSIKTSIIFIGTEYRAMDMFDFSGDSRIERRIISIFIYTTHKKIAIPYGIEVRKIL